MSRSNSSGVLRSWNDGRRDSGGLATPIEPVGLTGCSESTDWSDVSGFVRWPGDGRRPESELVVDDACGARPCTETDRRWEVEPATEEEASIVGSGWTRASPSGPVRTVRAVWAEVDRVEDERSGKRV